jgi:hypothetical protein
VRDRILYVGPEVHKAGGRGPAAAPRCRGVLPSTQVIERQYDDHAGEPGAKIFRIPKLLQRFQNINMLDLIFQF